MAMMFTAHALSFPSTTSEPRRAVLTPAQRAGAEVYCGADCHEQHNPSGGAGGTNSGRLTGGAARPVTCTRSITDFSFLKLIASCVP